ncbi:MAG TPA: S9 family peptidase, partial [Firmicutes bacterium]|nr:S9 family peptidase [Bacillota bacterium]
MENLKLADFTHYKFLSGVEYSPNGEFACFIVHSADLEENGYKSNLWLYDQKKDQTRQLTALGEERSFIWLADGEQILFPAMRDAKDKERRKKGEDFTVFYKINIHGGEAQEEFRLPLAVNSIKELPDERYLLTVNFNPYRRELDGLSEEEKAAELKKREEEKDYEVLEEIPFWSNGRGFVSKNRSRLYLYDKKSHSWEPLTQETFQVQSVELNEAKTKAVVAGQEYVGKAKMTNALYLVDLLTKAVNRITPEEEFSYANAHFVDDRQIICLGKDMQRFGLNENPRFYLVDVFSGERKLLTPD